MEADDGWDEWEQNDDDGYDYGQEEQEAAYNQNSYGQNINYSKDKCFVFITQEDVVKRLPKILEPVTEMLGLDNDSAIAAMRYYHWNFEKLQEKWFDNDEKAKTDIGLQIDKKAISRMPKNEALELNASLSSKNEGYCIICYASFADGKKDPASKPISMSCGHQFCTGCWQDYLKERIMNLGVDSLKTTCLQNGCNLIVKHSTITQIFENDQPVLKKYMRWHCQSFTDDNKTVKWCPFTKECDYAAERIVDTAKIVNCLCGNSFCFKCGQEQHKPADCEMYRQWEIKNSNESENINWIIANTKMCPNPKCQRPIEKNQGCNHITCKVCGYDFCWLCLGKWSDHNSTTGGYYKCNKFEEQKDVPTDASKKVEQAKFELNRYMFFFERYNNHSKAEKLARDLKPVIRLKMKQLHELKNYPQMELEFLNVTISEIIKCRQVLKYTYTYGYFSKNMEKQQKNLFEHQQTLLEEACELLHEQIERPLDPFLDPNIVDRTPFFKFKSNMINLCNVTSANYKAFIDSIENFYY